MNAWFSVLSGLFIVLFLVLVSLVGAGTANLSGLFGVFIPYAAGIIFLVGVLGRILAWAKTPVPFRIPTTCGQAVSLPWFKSSKLDCPHTTWGVIGRMALEVLLFRSLFRNMKGELRPGPRLTYASAKWLWLAGILFHYSFLTIVIRHLRFFTEPAPPFVALITTLDGFFEIFIPTVFLTDIAFLGAAAYLFLRRVAIPQVRYISLPADYVALFLILAIGVSGVLMRQVFKVDLLKVKELTMGLTGFTFTAPDGIPVIFYVHFFLVCCLMAYFPFSKLMHAGGVFFSPTRNMANNNRMVRYVSPRLPWDKEPKVHTYEEYEDEFRAKMKEVGLPVDKE
jgi:nitrate reductase gamma subunit